MSEKISTEAFIDRQMDDSALCATMGLMSELKRTYVESSIGKDSYEFFETVSPCRGGVATLDSLFPLEDTVDSIEYQAASANIAAWINATSQRYLPDNMKVCGVDDDSVSVAIRSDRLADTMRVAVIYHRDNELNINPAVYLIEQSARLKVIDQLREVDLTEFDDRSVFGIDIAALKGQVTEALIETYRAWQSYAVDDETVVLS